ncbi:MAG: flagellar basal body P-ring formation chaperone FlgA [Planctomycetota bacterium]
MFLAPALVRSNLVGTIAFLILVSCAAAAEPSSALPHATIAIHDRTVLNTARATLADVADIQADEETIARLKRIQVCDLPDLVPVSISPKLIIALATKAAAPSQIRVTGSGTVARRARIWTADELAAAAGATVAGTGVSWKSVRVSGEITAPASANLHLVAEGIDVNGVGDQPFKVRAMDGDREVGRSLVVLAIERRGSILVATRDLRRGEVVGVSDLNREMRVIDRSNRTAIDLEPANFVGRVVRRDIAAGTAVAADLLVQPPVVKSGASVNGVWTGKGFSIDVSVVALADARGGDRLTVRRVSDGAILHAVAQANGSVTIVR